MVDRLDRLNDIVHQLERVEFFSALDWDDLEAIAELVERERYPGGALVFQQGEQGRACYVVERGELRALHVDRDGVEREVGRFYPGDFFGESSLLLGEPHDATVEVVEDAVLLTISKSDFDQLAAEHPSLIDDLQITSETERRRRAPRFDWQEPDETVILVVHKHDAILVRRLLLPGLGLLLVLAGYFVAGIMSPLALVLGGILSALPLLYALYHIVDHFNDRYILTNRRVVHDEHVYLIHRSRVGAPLNNIQSVQEVQEGVLARAFGFGDLLIETAGEPGGVVAFRQVPDPTAVQEKIFRQRDRVQAQARAEERAAIQDVLHQRLGQEVSKQEARAAGEQEPADDEGQSRVPSWVLAPLHVARYFFPPLRYEQGDTITWRKHWVALLGPISRPTAAIAVVTLVVAWVLGRADDQVTVLLSYGILLMFLGSWWLWVFEDWQNDIYQVTSSRIIDVEQTPLGLREERREASLGMIQNVRLTVPGLIGRVLGYGSVTIETAGAGPFTFDYVKRPAAVQSEIFRRIEAFEKSERQKRAQRRQDELLDWFTVYDQMRHPEGQPGPGPVLPTPPQASDAPETSSSS